MFWPENIWAQKTIQLTNISCDAMIFCIVILSPRMTPSGRFVFWILRKWAHYFIFPCSLFFSNRPFALFSDPLIIFADFVSPPDPSPFLKYDKWMGVICPAPVTVAISLLWGVLCYNCYISILANLYQHDSANTHCPPLQMNRTTLHVVVFSKLYCV